MGRGVYELYCEQAPPADAEAGPPATGVVSRLRQRFSALLREAEEQQSRGDAAPPLGSGWMARLRHRGLAWVAERVAEQRLLWALRTADTAVLTHPDDIPFDTASAQVRGVLRRDYTRHRRWLIVNGLLLAASAALIILPGPNVVAYYLGFRVIGHWLSMRGATQGLQRTEWTGHPSTALTGLRTVAAAPPAERADRLHAIAMQLSLSNLPVFFERVARMP